MHEFNIKLRNEAKKIILKDFKTNCLKIKFRVKGLYKNLKFNAEVSFVVCTIDNKISINKLTISDLNVCDGSSSDFIFNNVYTLTTYDHMENDNYIKKIYNNLKCFANSIVIKKNGDKFDSVIFDSSKNKINKLNLKGYIRNYTN